MDESRNAYSDFNSFVLKNRDTYRFRGWFKKPTLYLNIVSFKVLSHLLSRIFSIGRAGIGVSLVAQW